jgi:4-hydroxy-3-methylbut-2-enyl diphosphate reductase IspH
MCCKTNVIEVSNRGVPIRSRRVEVFDPECQFVEKIQVQVEEKKGEGNESDGMTAGMNASLLA